MCVIKKVRADHVIDFAAEELKKYLRMMMPSCGDIGILYEPSAADGFRLGLLEDFGLDASDVEEPVLDDVVCIRADENGGILAGSNPRSVLFAVYRYLKENGCRWLYPGVDGEHVPLTGNTFRSRRSVRWTTVTRHRTGSAVTATRARNSSRACWKPSIILPSSR